MTDNDSGGFRAALWNNGQVRTNLTEIDAQHLPEDDLLAAGHRKAKELGLPVGPEQGSVEIGRWTPMTPKQRVRAERDARLAELRFREAQRPQIQAEGQAALRRLLPIAQRDTGQSRVIARFLLGLYNGNRFPFDLTDLRMIDYELFDDCMAVLRMDFQPQREVHLYFKDGNAIFEQIAKDWNVRDFAGGEDWRTTPHD